MAQWIDKAKRRAAGEEGTAVMEFAILLPIYVILAYGILYLGYTALVIQEGVELGHYAVFAEGSQVGSVSGSFYDDGYEGEYELEDDTDKGDVFSGENPTSGNDEFDIHDILTELSYTFWGGFTLKGGKIVYETEGGQNWIGRRVDKFQMMEENDATAWMLNGWVWRSTAGVEYTYSPYFLPAVNQENLLVQEVDEQKEFTELTVKTTNHTMVRGDRERPLGDDLSGENIYELTDQFPTGSGNRLPGYSNFLESKPWWTKN